MPEWTCGRRCGTPDAIRTLAENASNMPSTVRGTPPPCAPHSSTPYLPVIDSSKAEHPVKSWCTWFIEHSWNTAVPMHSTAAHHCVLAKPSEANMKKLFCCDSRALSGWLISSGHFFHHLLAPSEFGGSVFQAVKKCDYRGDSNNADLKTAWRKAAGSLALAAQSFRQDVDLAAGQRHRDHRHELVVAGRRLARQEQLATFCQREPLGGNCLLAL